MRGLFSLVCASALLAACNSGSNGEVVDPALADQSSDPAPEAVLETLSTGANISGANGIHFGPDGLLYVTSVIGSDLTVLDPETGEKVKRFTAEDGVFGPDDVAFAPDGSYYWTSILTGEVAGFTPDGEKVVAARIPPGANPITFSEDGRLFVSQCFLGSNLYELDPKGEEAPRLIADDLGPGCGLNGMDWGPDGRLYGPRWFVGEVLSFDVDTGERRVEATGFSVPAAVKFDSEGRLHVLDTGTGEVIRVSGDSKEVVGTLMPGLDNFAFDASDTLFVSSFTDGFVKRQNADGTFTDLQPGGMSHPGGVTVIGDTVWVADASALRGFDRDTGEEIVTQRNIVGVSELGGTLSIARDGDNLILSSWFDSDVRVWDPETQTRLQHIPNLAGPSSAVRYQDELVVAEHLKGSVTSFGEETSTVIASDLTAPTALVVEGDDLYVSDRTEGQILMIAQGGEALATPIIVVDDLANPEGFLVTENGYVIVEAETSRILHVSNDGERREIAAFPAGSPGLPGLPPSQIFNGIAMDEDGTLFVTGEHDRVLYRIKAPW
jgi:sugar lactone lactonase YvrE